MADRSPPADTTRDVGEDGGAEPDRRTAPRTPRWVLAFGVIAVVLIVVVAIQLLLGVQHGPGMHAPPADAGAATTTASGGATDVRVGGPADADEAARSMEVTALDTMTFEPSTIDVSAGDVITFVVTNRGQAAHEFTLGDAAMQQEHADAMAHMPDGMAHDLPNSIRLEPGETKELTWRFGDPRTLEYACHEPGHYEAGMRGQLTVS
jgi:uncharacterized cupredoxin-like copper-binding protein